MGIEKVDLPNEGGKIGVEMKWSDVKDCTIYYENNELLQIIFLWAQRGDKIVHGWTIEYEYE